MDVYGDSGKRLNESQLLAQFQSVVEQSSIEKSPIGILTTLHRDSWANAYNRLRKCRFIFFFIPKSNLLLNCEICLHYQSTYSLLK